MTMQSVYFKEHEGIGSLSSGSGPWWSGLVTQSAYGESIGQLKSSSSSMEHPPPPGGEQLTLMASKQSQHSTGQGLEKGSQTHFTVFPGDCKSSANGQKSMQLQSAFSVQSVPPEYRGCLELGFGQPVVCGKYPYGDQCYGLFSTYGPQMTGRIMLPLNLTTDDGPIFVNAKQYHGILRRRRSRAKAEMANKAPRNRKPFLHLSRHRHAKRRPRGCNGRFLNTKELDGGEGGTDSKKTGEGIFSQPTGSQNSEVLQSDNSNLTSPRETSGSRSHISGSEVTSMFSMGDLNHFPIGNFQASVVSLSEMMISERAKQSFTGMPSKWVAAAIPDSRCNLKV